MMEAEALCPDTNHSPSIQDDNTKGDDIEHRFGRESISLLDPPEAVNSDCLSCDAYNQEISEGEGVVGDDTILKRCDDCDCGVERVSKKEVPNQVNERLLELPYLTESSPELPESDGDYVHTRRNLLPLVFCTR